MDQVTSNEEARPLKDVELDDAFTEIAKDTKVSTVSFSPQETEILDLYDQLQDLRLENALMNAQISQAKGPPPDLSSEEAEARLREAEKENLDARAAYLLKENIVKNVVQADPLMKAIHSGANANPLERKLHPLIDARDVLSLTLTNLSTRHQAIANSLASTQVDSMRTMRQNQELTATLLKLAEEAKDVGPESIGDPDFQKQLVELKAKTKAEKRQYRIMKALVSAIVAGSGYDWSRDEGLRELVLDDED